MQYEFHRAVRIGAAIVWVNNMWEVREERLSPGAPGRTRTCNPQFRRLMLYPVELRARDSRIIVLGGSEMLGVAAGDFQMAGPERFERPTPSFVAKCSIQLSYGPVTSV